MTGPAPLRTATAGAAEPDDGAAAGFFRDENEPAPTSPPLRHPVATQWILAICALGILAILGAGLRASSTSSNNLLTGPATHSVVTHSSAAHSSVTHAAPAGAVVHSPLSTVRSWAVLVQSGDALGARGDLDRAAQAAVGPGSGSPAGWGTGDRAVCRLAQEFGDRAEVSCLVTPADAPGSDRAIWGLSVIRQADGAWLIARFTR